MEVVASLSQGRTAIAQCGLFTHKSVPVIFEPPCSNKQQHTVIKNKTSATHYSESIHATYCNSAVVIQYNLTQTYSRNIIMDTTNNQQLTQYFAVSD